MLKIGDAVKRFMLSHRTLRYWEEVKILSSEREENGYRCYDDFNASRIEQIAFLRQLKLPIAEIKRILISGNDDMTIDILTCHLCNVQQDTAELTGLYGLLENIIDKLKSEGNFSLLTSTFIDSEASQIMLSENERSILMRTLKTEPDRFVRLPKMVMACYRAESENPEMDCYSVISEFIKKHSLHEQYGFRHFGFNSPNPSDEIPVYGYEMWVSIPEGIEVTAPLCRMEFEGGLYACVTTTLAEIGEQSWKLYEWVNSNRSHKPDTTKQWLEEFTDYESFWENVSSEKQIDLLAPII